MFRNFSLLKKLALPATIALLSFPTLKTIKASTPTTGQQESYWKEWKKHRIGRYENRIRKFSHPFKVFSYFASVKKEKDGRQVSYMTARDFIKSLLPYNPLLEGSRSRVPSAEAFFSLADLDGDGLIDYPEYLLFLTLIATPEYHWKISFKLFDQDGDGTVCLALN